MTTPASQASPPPQATDQRTPVMGWVGILLTLLLLALVAAGWAAARAAGSRVEIQLPLLAVAGVLILLVALAVTAVSFATFGLSNTNEALALPAGSVRAVIALSLIVIFSILTVYLYGSLSSGVTTELVSGVNAAQRDDLLKKFSADQLTRISSRETGTADTTAGTKVTTVPTYTVYNTVTASQPSQDFAKQLLAMLGVLLSSVTGFYFGAKTAQNAKNDTTNTNDSNKKNQQTPQPQGGGGARTQQPGDPAKLAAANLTATPEAAALGHDPTLASDPSADDLNKGTA